MKKGLVLEGGAMRGMFTAGVLDVLMHEGITFDGAIGVSAGAAFGCNIKSKQIGRAIRYNMAYCRDPRYCSIASFLLTGDLYNGHFDYQVVPFEKDIWDKKTFEENPMEFYCVATDAATGKPLYHKCTDGGKEDLLWIQGSASMPIVSKPVVADGYKLLDGGISDSVPLCYFESIGYDRNVVVLTQPALYRKKEFSRTMEKVIRTSLRNSPEIVTCLLNRYERYNAEIADICKKEQEGKVFVIRPSEPLNIGSVCHKTKELQRVYEIGVKTMEEQKEALVQFLKG